METTTTLEAINWIIGGSGVVGFIVSILTIRWARRKVKGEARDAENEATKKLQEIYQTMVADQQKQNEELKEYCEELKVDRRHIREERDELRNQVYNLQKEQMEQAEKIAQLGRMVKAMAPLICGNTKCKMRERERIGLVSDDSFDNSDSPQENKNTKKKPAKRKKETNNGSDT